MLTARTFCRIAPALRSCHERCSCVAAQYVGRASDIGSTTQIEVPLRSGRAAVAATLIHFRCGLAL